MVPSPPHDLLLWSSGFSNPVPEQVGVNTRPDPLVRFRLSSESLTHPILDSYQWQESALLRFSPLRRLIGG
jgi:hypothetical protein